MRKKYLAVLEDKERNQERNIHGLVQYAKTLRGELEKYREDVEMSEKIVADLQASGNDSVDNLLGMLKKYKRQQKNCVDEIKKLNELDVVKAAEIQDLNQEIALLTEIQQNASSVFEEKFKNARRMVEENRAIIKRQDKLTVDLQQKREVCSIKEAQIEEEVQKQKRCTTDLEMKIKEITDQRSDLTQGIKKMETQLKAFREHRFQEMQPKPRPEAKLNL